MSRTEAAAETRAALLLAARGSIVVHGYHGSGMDQIAAAANVTRVTVYRHFGSKQGLLDALLEQLALDSRVVGEMRAAHAEPDDRAALTAIVAALCRLWDTDPMLLRRLVGLAAVDPDVRTVLDRRDHWRRDQIGRYIARVTHRLAAPFTPGQAAGVLHALTSFTGYDETRGPAVEDAAATLAAAAAVILESGP